MKLKSAIVFFAVILCILLFGVSAYAAPSVDGNGDTYDDNDFAQIQAFLNQMSTNGVTSNGELLNASYDPLDPATWDGVTWNAAGIRRVTDIDWYENYYLNGNLDLSGFEALTSAEIGVNSIDSLSVDGAAVLTHLGASSNNLSTLDVSTLSALTDFSIRSNNFSSIDISSNSALQNFNCSVNDITSLNLSGNTGLITLDCRSNDISALNLSGLNVLTDLNCSYNNLTTLDLSTNLSLVTVNATSNSLTALDISPLNSLLTLECNNNSIGTIDLSSNADLESLSVSGNGLSSLDVSSNTSLTYLLCSYNPLGTLDLTANTALEYLYANECQLSTLGLSTNTSLVHIYASDNSFAALDVSNNTSLTQLRVANNNITSLSLTTNASLEYLDIENNDLSSLNTSASPNLGTINAADNQLTTAVVSGSTALSTLTLNNNLLTSIDLTSNGSLRTLRLNDNDLTSINITNNTLLDYAYLQNNSISALDASANTSLDVLQALGNKLYSFDIEVAGTPVSIHARGLGTVGVLYNTSAGSFYAVAAPNPTYDFDNWTDPSSTILSINTTYNINLAEATTVYANFTAGVIFDENGGDTPSDPAYSLAGPGDLIIEPAVDPIYTGLAFEGWFTEPEQSTLWNFATDVVPPSGVLTLYAGWSGNFTVSFNGNGGAPVPSSVIVPYNTTFTEPVTVPTRTGYDFGGWCTDPAGTIQWDFATDTVAGNMTLYVKWIPGEYIVYFNSPGATTPASPATLSFSYEELISPIPSPPTRSGYTFDAWYFEPGLITPVNFSTFLVTEDVNLYAGWIPNTYTVTFNRNGGETDPIPLTMLVDYNTLIPSQPTAPTRTGYVLDAWCTDMAGLNEWHFATDRVLGNMTLYARWAETHTVTFNNNGGTTQANPQTMTIADDHIINPAPIPPMRTGYTFSGWYTTPSATTAWTFASDVVTSDITLYAGWTQNSYTVTFNQNGGDTAASPSTMSVLYNTLIPSEPTPPTLSGFLFEAWYTDAGTTTLWDFDSDVVTGNLTLYAGYAEYFTVTFDENGGSVPASPNTVDVVENQTVGTVPTSPIWGGYQFSGWYTEPAATNLWDFDTDIVTGDMTLYAGWSSICTVTFDQNGGDTVPIPNNKQTLVGGTVTPPAISPTRAGYTFRGWYTTSAAVTQWNFTNPVTSNMTLFAGWTGVEYTVTFNENGGDSLAVPGSMLVEYGQLITPQPTPPTRAGYAFSGWYTDAAATTTWDFATDTVSQNTTLYAGWAQSNTVIFSSNGGDTQAVPSSLAVLTGDLITPPAPPTRLGYTFSGWYIDSAATLAFDISTNAVTGDMILYAGWAANTYTVTFDENGGDTAAFPTEMTTAYGGLIAPQPADPGLTGYAFSGWYTDASGATEWDFDTDVVTGDITLYAAYVPLVTVTFDENGGDTPAVPATLTVGLGLTIDTLPTPPTMADYAFVGWYTDAALTTLWIPSVDTVSGPITLYAGWTDIMRVVTFDVNGGTFSDAIETYSVPNGSFLMVVPEDPTRNGYVFEGWYADAAGTIPWDFATDTVTGDTVLYALWSAALAMEASPSSGEIYEDGRIEITPSISGGVWVYDDTYLSAEVTSTGVVFTGLREGETTVTYTVNGQTVQYTITIAASELPSTGQSYTLLIVLCALFAAVSAVTVFAVFRQKRINRIQRV